MKFEVDGHVAPGFEAVMDVFEKNFCSKFFSVPLGSKDSFHIFCGIWFIFHNFRVTKKCSIHEILLC